MSETWFKSPFGERQLLRRPRRKNEVLQAWDAADHYVLNDLAEQGLPTDARILLVNDRFGALALSLSDFTCESWSDSAVAGLAVADNARLNQLPQPAQLPATALPAGGYSHILFKLPKSHSLIRYQLQRLLPLCGPDTVLLGATMAKHLDASVMALLNEVCGEVRASLAWKKARLLHFQPAVVNANPTGQLQEDRIPTWVPELSLNLQNRANVFSRGKVDRGSRLLLSVLKQLPCPTTPRIADLGCGNGLLGLAALVQWPQAELHCFDDSYLAVDSARENFTQHHPGARVLFHADDCMSGYSGPGFDLVLCNPPFHQEHDLGDQIARQMFKDAQQHLRSGGYLCVVGNRHLPYHIILKKQFANLNVIASDAKFVVHLAQRR